MAAPGSQYEPHQRHRLRRLARRAQVRFMPIAHAAGKVLEFRGEWIRVAWFPLRGVPVARVLPEVSPGARPLERTLLRHHGKLHRKRIRLRMMPAPRYDYGPHAWILQFRMNH